MERFVFAPSIHYLNIELIDEVLLANLEFYSSFEEANLDRMSEVWEHSDSIRCTHPGWPTLRGWGEISGSFYNLFHAQRGLQFILTDTDVRIENHLAMVSTTENILGQSPGSTVATMNIFRFDHDDKRWLMIVHHASPVTFAIG